MSTTMCCGSAPDHWWDCEFHAGGAQEPFPHAGRIVRVLTTSEAAA